MADDPNARPCSRCKNVPPLLGQRWCQDCFNDYRRTKRAAQYLTEYGSESLTSSKVVGPKNGQRERPPAGAPDNARDNADNALSPATFPGTIGPAWIYAAPTPFMPFRDAPERAGWPVAFLADFSVHGGRALAASRAGVTMKTVERLIETDHAFAEEVQRAHEYYKDLLEWECLNLGRRRNNPLPFFDRLKAELPARHLERLQVSSVTLNVDLTGELDETAARAFLCGLLEHVTDATRALLASEGTLSLALPEGSADGAGASADPEGLPST